MKADPALYDVSNRDLLRALNAGLCREIGSEVFREIKVGGAADAARAKRICLGCEVRAECLEWALRHDFYGHGGVAGGASPNEHRVLRRERHAVIEAAFVDEMIEALA